VADHPSDKSKAFVPVYDNDGLLLNDDIPIESIKLVTTVLKNGQAVEKGVKTDFVVAGPPVSTDSDERTKLIFNYFNALNNIKSLCLIGCSPAAVIIRYTGPIIGSLSCSRRMVALSCKGRSTAISPFRRASYA
jgi:hypothetical protein